MKYLKLFENKIEDFFKDKINWDLIESLKDISLIYLEENGHQINIEVYSCHVNKGVISMTKSGSIYTESFSCDNKVSFFRNQDYVIPGSIDTYNKYHRLLYRFYMSGFAGDKDYTQTILSRIRKMYPNETIGGMTERPPYIKKGQ